MVRHSVKHPQANRSTLFSAAQEPTLTSRLFWVQVLAYRPLLLLGSLWLVMVCLSAVAYNRLMFTEPPVTTGSSPVRAEVGLNRSNVPPVSSSSGTPALEPENELNTGPLDPEKIDGIGNAASSQLGVKVTLWGLLSLVGLCSLGCFVISQQANARPQKSQRPKRRVRKAVKRSAPPTPARPKRLAPYSPQRDGIMVTGAKAVSENSEFEAPLPPLAAPIPNTPSPAVTPASGPPLPPRLTKAPPSADRVKGKAAAQNGGPTLPKAPFKAQPPGPQIATSLAEPHQPAIVPDSEAHPLDWSEASLAHTLDLRQRRSLSSLI